MAATELHHLISVLLAKASALNTTQSTVHLSSLISILETAKANTETTLLPTSLIDTSNCVSYFVTVLIAYLTDTLGLLDAWQPDNRKMYEEMSILISKLSALMELFGPATEVDSGDLFMRGENHPSWQRLREITEVILPENAEVMKQKIESFARKVAIGNAMLHEGTAYQDRFMKKLIVGSGAMYYSLCRDAAVQQTRLNYANPDLETAKSLWNLVDSRLVSPMYQSLIPSIHQNCLIYLPRVAAKVLASLYDEEDEEVTLHSGKHYIEQLQDEPLHSMVAYTDSIDPAKVRVQVRVLSPYDLPMAYGGRRQWWQMCCGDIIPPEKSLKQLILHFHGGGFISMSSASHQNYTRRWAMDTDTPVLSVDYRLSPESKYPDGLDDCWQAYVWVVRYAKKYLGIAPDKVVLAGDSAGANFALGVTLRCIQTGTMLPSGLLLTYPCVNLDMHDFSPSLSKCLEDPLVPYSFLKLCLQCYLRPTDDPKTDPYLSPILIPFPVLSQFPPVRIMVGSEDPLKDHSWKLADRLLEAGVQVKLALFEGMGHGALNMDLTMGVSDTRKMVNKGAEFLKELLEI
jgi:hormone-sensitive lipase